MVLGTMYSRSDADGDDGLHGMSEVNPYKTIWCLRATPGRQVLDAHDLRHTRMTTKDIDAPVQL